MSVSNIWIQTHHLTSLWNKMQLGDKEHMFKKTLKQNREKQSHCSRVTLIFFNQALSGWEGKD